MAQATVAQTRLNTSVRRAYGKAMESCLNTNFALDIEAGLWKNQRLNRVPRR